MIRSNKSFGTLMVIPFLALLTGLTCATLDFSQTDALTLVVLFGNGCFFAAMISYALNKRSFSIELILWIFMFFFMFYAPLIQYAKGYWPWKGSLDHNDVIFMSLLCLLFSVCFCVGKQLYSSFSKDHKQPPSADALVNGFLYAPFHFSPIMKTVSASISVILALIFLARNGFAGVMVSRADVVNPFYSGNNSAVLLLIDSCIPAFLAYCAAVSAQGMMSDKKSIWWFILQLACLLICSFPTAIPRYKMACIYAPLCMTLFPRMKKKTAFFWTFVLALFLIFPVFSIARRSLDFGAAIAQFRDNFIENYLRGDYDAFRMLSGTVDYVGEHGATWGGQLLGTLFFFVPSSIWTGKPGGSGSLVIRTALSNDIFSNVSCPFIGEGYINFGIIGVIVFALLFGYFAKKLDTRYWLIADKYGASFSPYLYLIMLIFFVLRGDLLSGFAYTVGFMAVGFAMRVGSQFLNWKRG